MNIWLRNVQARCPDLQIEDEMLDKLVMESVCHLESSVPEMEATCA